MDNTNYWPYTNIHELNLDWIISKVKELDTRFTDDIETFVREYIDEHFAEWTVNANYNPDDETIIYTNGTGATLTAGDVIRFAIDNAFVNVKDPTARTAAATAQDTADNNTANIASLDTAYKAADTAINNAIGALSSLTTNDKSSIVNAINELDRDMEFSSLNFSDYITINSGYVLNTSSAMRISKHIGIFYFEITGTIPVGDTAIGTISSNILLTTYGSCRISGSTTVSGTVMVNISSRLLRVETATAGTGIAGTLILPIA